MPWGTATLPTSSRLLGNGLSLPNVMSFLLYVFAHTVRIDAIAQIQLELPFKAFEPEDLEE